MMEDDDDVILVEGHPPSQLPKAPNQRVSVPGSSSHPKKKTGHDTNHSGRNDVSPPPTQTAPHRTPLRQPSFQPYPTVPAVAPDPSVAMTSPPSIPAAPVTTPTSLVRTSNSPSGSVTSPLTPSSSQLAMRPPPLTPTSHARQIQALNLLLQVQQMQATGTMSASDLLPQRRNASKVMLNSFMSLILELERYTNRFFGEK